MGIDMPWWEIIGWAGSVLVVLSLMVPSVRRFRILNLTGSFIATVYNVYFEIWPYAAMNGAIVLINVYWLWRLHQEGSSQERGYSVVPADSRDAVVKRFLTRNGTAITAAYPHFDARQLEGAYTHLVMHEEEVIGLFAVQARSGGIGDVVLDFVTERFRDLTPGHYIYTNSFLFARLGISSLEVLSESTADTSYFKKQGFEAYGDHLVKDL